MQFVRILCLANVAKAWSGALGKVVQDVHIIPLSKGAAVNITRPSLDNQKVQKTPLRSLGRPAGPKSMGGNLTAAQEHKSEGDKLMHISNNTHAAIAGRGHHMVKGEYTIMTADKNMFSNHKYLHISSMGYVTTWKSVDGPEAKWTISVDEDKRVQIANKKWPDKLLTFHSPKGCGALPDALCSYDLYTCTMDDVVGCWHNWEIYRPKEGEAHGDPDSVIMHLQEADLFLEHDCKGYAKPHEEGMWYFKPPLPASVIFGETDVFGENIISGVPAAGGR